MRRKEPAGTKTVTIHPQKITKASFKKYGYIIELRENRRKRHANQFRIIVRERKTLGWRIAYLIVREKKVAVLEQHPCSMESFEPVKGRAILYVSNQKEPKKIECFGIDKPVVLKKGIWHAVVTRSREAHIKITENNRVKLLRYKLKFLL